MTEATTPGPGGGLAPEPSAPDRPRAGGRRRARRTALIVALLALVGAAVLAGSRVADPVTGRPVQLVAVVPAGLPLALIGLLLGLVALRSPTARLALGVPALVLVLVHGAWLAPRYLGAVPQARPGCTVRVLSVNAQTAGPELAAEVARIAPDVAIFLQTYPQRLHGVVTANPQFTTVHGLYDHDAQEVVMMTGLPVTIGDIGLRGEIGRLQVQSPCLGTVDVFGAHPVAPHPDAPWDLDHQRLTAYLQGTVGAALSAGRARVLVAGDFNATLDHAQLRRTLDLGLRDAFEETDAGWVPTYPAPGTTTWHGLPMPTVAAIDHVLVSDGLAVAEVHTVTIPGADHLGIVATVGSSAG